MTNSSLAVIGKLVNLEKLCINECNFTDAGLHYLSNLPRLRALSVSMNEGGKITHEGLLRNNLSRLIIHEIY